MNNDNLFITDYLALSICNKKIRYNEGKNLNQDVNYIYAFHYIEAIHEIAHWIAAEPSSRNFYNLGLPECDVEIEHPIFHRMYSEEQTALVLSKLLFDKFIPIFNVSEKEIEFIEYLNSSCETLSVKISQLDSVYARKRATELFEEYTNHIEIPTFINYTNQFNEINNN